MKTLSKESIYRIIPALNLVLCFSVLGLVLYLMHTWKHQSLPHSQRFEAALIEPLIKLREPPVFKEWIFKNRQLFSTTPVAKAQGARSAYILLGVSIGSKNMAMIRDQAQNKNYYCAPGDSIGPFKVKQILKDKVILESVDNTLELTK